MRYHVRIALLLASAASLTSTLASTLVSSAAHAAEELRIRFVPAGTSGIDLARTSFQDLRAWVERAQASGDLVLPLPFASSPFEAIQVTRGEIAIDATQRTLVVAGEGRVRGRATRMFLSANFAAAGPGRYAFGVRPEALDLVAWFPALKGTPLADVKLADAGLVLASAAHALPGSALVAAILGESAAGGPGIEVTAGVGVRATLVAESLPPVGRLLTRLGLGAAQVRLVGRVGSQADLLLGDERPQPLDLALHAELGLSALVGLQSRLPSRVRPTGLAPSLDVSYSAAAGLTVGLALDVAVDVAGESRPFRVSATLDTGSGVLTLRGETTAAWARPLGIPWVNLPSASLTVTGDGASAQVQVASSLRIGAREAQIDVALDEGSARLVSRLPDLSLGDLAAFVAERLGSTFLKDLRAGDAVKLKNVVLTLARAEHPSLEVSATLTLGNASADLLFTLTGSASGVIEPLLAIRRHAGRLSDILPVLAGRPADLTFPEAVWTLSPPKPGAVPRVLSSAKLGPAARAFLAQVYGPGPFEVQLHPGIQFGGRLPVSALPASLVQTLGVQDPRSSLLLEGSLAMTLDLGSGRPSAAIDALELTATLPRVAGATTRLPAGLPDWMRPDTSAQRTLSLRYTAPSSVAFMLSNEALADLDGATRRFVITTEVALGEAQASAMLRGRMAGTWAAPFGLGALTLRDVTLSAGARTQSGAGGGQRAGVSLEGGFDLGRRSGRMRVELEAATGKGLSGSFAGSLDSLALGDLADLEFFPNVPRDGLTALTTLLGQLPPLVNPTLRVAFGDGQPSVTLTASTTLRGIHTDLLAFVARGPSGTQAVLAVRPTNFSLAKVFPALGTNPAVAGLANLTLDRFGLLAVLGDVRLTAADVSPEVRRFFVALTGENDFELALSAGLNLEARLPSDALPPDFVMALAKLNRVLGQDGVPSLALRGALGTSLSNLRLAMALPPLKPARAPKWLKSGQLAVVVTGAPSIMLGATLTVDLDGDILELLVEGGVERQGGNVAIALKSALQADAAWTSPFGLEWLEIRRFSGQFSIDALANVGLGGGGDVTIGSKDIKVFAWTKINSATGIPMGLVLSGSSKAGVALRDLAVLQAQMRRAANASTPAPLPLALLPDIAIRDFNLLIASRAVPEEGIDSAGFKLKGDLYLPLRPGAEGSRLLAVDLSLTKEGIVAKGALGAFRLGPLVWEDALFDLEATLASQHLIVHGVVEIMGSRSATDLQLRRDGLSFTTTRALAGIGSTHLEVRADFDLRRPSFQARGTLESEFRERLGGGAAAEVTDIVGKLAAASAAALEALAKARRAAEAARDEFGLPAALDLIEAVAAKRVADAQAAAAEHKRELDRLHREWKATPDNQPVRKQARETLWAAHKLTYDEGPLSKIVVLNRRKAQHERVRALLATLEQAKAASERAQALLAGELAAVAKYKGATIVIRSASFETGFDGLLALRDGMPLDISLDLLFLGQPRTVKLAWVVGRPAVNARRLARTLLPGPAQAAWGDPPSGLPTGSAR